MILKIFTLIFIVYTSSIARAESEAITGLKYYTSCHNAFEKINNHKSNTEINSLCLKYKVADNLGNFQSLAKTLGLDSFLRFKELEDDKTSLEAHAFLEKCSEKKSRFDREIGMLAKEAYDISFRNRDNPTLENNHNGKAPEGYQLKKFYGNNPDECFNSGFKAAQFIPNSGDFVVFAITGTEASKSYSNGLEREKYKTVKTSILGRRTIEVTANEKDKEDWFPPTGGNQFKTSCAKRMIEEAVLLAKKENKKIIFTGHSLGGALSQAMSYRVEEALSNQNIPHQRVEAITFMSAGGRALIKNADPKIENQIDNIIYASLGDIVPTLGTHIGEIREMIRTDKAEKEVKQFEKSLIDTHTLDLTRFKDLKESIHVSGQELSQRKSRYSKDYMDEKLKSKEAEKKKAEESNAPSA